MPVWVLAFFTAAFLTLVTTPLLRRLALVTDLVDKPGQHKSHHLPTPYLGGVGVVLSVMAGLALDRRLSPQAAAVAFSAAVLGTVGLLDDDRTVDPRYRFLAQVAAAAAAAAVGIRIHATGVAPLDIAITIVWIVGVTNALNLLDNMDGLTAGVAAVASGAVFSLAILARQPALATLAAAVMGACLGFLFYNRRPASIFMGDAGSLFLGFAVAVLTIDVRPALAPPFGFIIPLVLLGLPVLDTTTVTLARLRRGRSVLMGGRDHLSHRLVARGLSSGNAVLVLIGVQAVLGGLAVLGGRRVIQLRWTALGAAGVLALLTLLTCRVRVYDEPVIGLPRRLKLAIAGLVVAAPLLSVPALLAVAQAASPARAGASSARQALAAMRGSDGTRAATDFEEASRYFAEADRHLGGPFVSMGLAVPGLSSNLQATRALVSIGRQLSDAAGRMAEVAEGDTLWVRDGAVDLGEMRALAADLTDTATLLQRSRTRLAAIDRPFLLPPLQRAVRELNLRVDREALTVDRAAQSARLLPAILGADGPRRYFLAFQNNSAIAGTGGFIGNWGELTAEDGQVELGRFGRLGELNQVNPRSRVLHMPFDFKKRWLDFHPELFWQDVNISPDFPTTARVIGDLYPQSGGQPVDGVIAIDPVGLSALLELTGPVTVASWPEPVSAGNVTDAVLRDAYERFPLSEDQQRIDFLGDLSHEVAKAFTTVDLGNPALVARALGKAVRNGHLMVQLNSPEEQRLMERLGADGAVPELRGDSLMVVNQNMAANKIDYYLRRRLRYDVTLDPGNRPSSISGRVAVTLENRATDEGLPIAVIGPYAKDFVAGENRTYVSIYTPFSISSATLDGRPFALVSDPDLGRQAHSATVSIPAVSSRTVALDVKGQVQLTPDGWYRLDLPHQPTLTPDDVSVSLTVPTGWRVVETRGADRVGDRQAEARIDQDTLHTVWVRVERTSAWARVWDRLRDR